MRMTPDTMSDLAIPFGIDPKSNRFVYFNAEIVNGYQLLIDNKLERKDAQLLSARPSSLAALELSLSSEERHHHFFLQDRDAIYLFLQDMDIQEIREDFSNLNMHLFQRRMTAYLLAGQSVDNYTDVVAIAKK